MTTQNRRDFFKTAAFIGATAATLPNASTKAEENSKFPRIEYLNLLIPQNQMTVVFASMFVFFSYTQLAAWNLKSTVSYSF